jgi:hypothetical protein
VEVRRVLVLTVLSLVLLVGCGSQKKTTVTCATYAGVSSCTRTENSSGKADGIVGWAKDNTPAAIALCVLGVAGIASLVDKAKTKTPDKS